MGRTGSFNMGRRHCFGKRPFALASTIMLGATRKTTYVGALSNRPGHEHEAAVLWKAVALQIIFTQALATVSREIVASLPASVTSATEDFRGLEPCQLYNSGATACFKALPRVN